MLALARFFNAQLFNGEGIHLLCRSLKTIAPWHPRRNFLSGLNLINHPLNGEEEYDFTRLFVGPGPLPAPPYGSAYTGVERLLMQEETLAVRRFYRKCGLASRKEGSQPDDFLATELEFLGYLLTVADHCAKLDDQAWQVNFRAHNRFRRLHLLPWIKPFAKDIILHAQTDLLQGIGMVLPAALRLKGNEWLGYVAAQKRKESVDEP